MAAEIRTDPMNVQTRLAIAGILVPLDVIEQWPERDRFVSLLYLSCAWANPPACLAEYVLSREERRAGLWGV